MRIRLNRNAFGAKNSANNNIVADGTLLHKKLSFAATEAYKLLRTNLMFALPDEGKCRVIGVTSSLRGEGKSTTAINLSYALSETGKRVLLIDADLRLPSIAKKLDIDRSPGLSNVLVGITEARKTVKNSGVLDNWNILTAGDIPPNPTELLGSAQMKEFIDSIKGEYDFIIVDLPPVNIVSDSLAASPVLDGIIVVVRENYSTRSALNSCTRSLSLSKVKILGFVMTVVGDDDGSYGRYKRNKYYYKSYKGYEKSKPSKKLDNETEKK